MTPLLLALWQVVKPHALVLGSCLVIGLGGFWLGYHVGHPPAPIPVQVAQAHTDTVRQLVQQTDTLVTTKTRVLAHTDTAYQELRDTVLQQIHDTVAVKQFVQACDSLKGACGAFRGAAQAKFHADSLLFAAQAQELAAWTASRPSLGHRLLVDAAWAVVGGLADHYLIPPRHRTIAAFSIHVPAPPHLLP